VPTFAPNAAFDPAPGARGRSHADRRGANGKFHTWNAATAPYDNDYQAGFGVTNEPLDTLWQRPSATIPTSNSYLMDAAMQVTDKGQVTIPKHIRVAAGVAAGSEVAFSLEGSKIVITPVSTRVKNDRRAELRAAAVRVRNSLDPEFRQLGATEIMAFLRGDSAPVKRGRR